MPNHARGGDLTQLRRLNSHAVLNTLREGGEVRLSTLAKRAGLSRVSTKEVVDGLIDLGWVETVPPAPGTMGRPAQQYRFRASLAHLVAVELRTTSIRVGIGDLGGNLIADVRYQTETIASKAEYYNRIVQAINSCLRIVGNTAGDTRAIVVALEECCVDYELSISPVSPNLEHAVEVMGLLQDEFSCNVFLEQAHRMAALAEVRRGALKGIREAIYLHLCCRTSATIIVNSQIYRGFTGAAGGIEKLLAIAGDTVSRPLSSECISSQTSNMEIPVTALAADLKRNSDAAAVGCAEELAAFVEMLALLLDPQVVVFGGDYSRLNDLLLPMLRHSFNGNRWGAPALRGPLLDDDCVILGGIEHMVDRFNESFFNPDLPLRSSAFLSNPR